MSAATGCPRDEAEQGGGDGAVARNTCPFEVRAVDRGLPFAATSSLNFSKMDVLVPQINSDLVYTDDTGCQWHTVLVSHIEGENAFILKNPSNEAWAVDDDVNDYSTIVSSASYCKLSKLQNKAKAWSGCHRIPADKLGKLSAELVIPGTGNSDLTRRLTLQWGGAPHPDGSPKEIVDVQRVLGNQKDQNARLTSGDLTRKGAKRMIL